jgi:hypothetical protein
MKKFFVEVDKSNKKEMIKFLINHVRYWTLSSWNKMSSYACNVKIYQMGFEREVSESLYNLTQLQEFFDDLDYIFDNFFYDTNKQYRIGFNGRSNGYLVLYNNKSGNSIDHTDILDWDIDQLKERVDLVQTFDKAIDEYISCCVYTAKNAKIVEETYTVEKTRQVIKYNEVETI